MPSAELAKLLMTTHSGTIERHVDGKRPFRAIVLPVQLASNVAKGKLMPRISKTPVKRPVSTTVFSFLDAGKAQKALQDTFTLIKRKHLGAEVYIPQIGHTPNKLVLNIFATDLADRWSKEIGRPTASQLSRARRTRREKITRMKRD
ncbi:MAG: hypothetical protein Q8R15_04635 [Candidatus Micrarchaeota archaeon]|nr:hypothetical protein [Candidatus Micrarchaeota archaeon]